MEALNLLPSTEVLCQELDVESLNNYRVVNKIKKIPCRVEVIDKDHVVNEFSELTSQTYRLQKSINEYGSHHTLINSIKKGNLKDVTLLMDLGIDISRLRYQINPILLDVIEKGYTDIVKLLLDKGIHIEDKYLLEAVRYNHYDMAKLLLDLGLDPNYATSTAGAGFSNKYGDTSLLWAVSNQNYDMVKLLLDNGADIDKIKYSGFSYDDKSFNALTLAVGLNNVDIIKLLLNQGANPNILKDYGPAIIIAIERDSSEIVDILIKAGSELDSWTWRKIFDLNPSFQMLEQLISVTDPDLINSVFFFSTKNNNVTILDFIYKNYPISQSILDKALNLACAYAQPSIVRRLIELGADPNSTDNSYEAPCLYRAVEFPSGTYNKEEIREIKHNQMVIIKMLLHPQDISPLETIKPSDPNFSVQNDRTILGNALKSYRINLGAIHLLIDAGVDVNKSFWISSSEAKTPLNKAIEIGYLPLIRSLLENGADPNFQGEDLYVPLKAFSNTQRSFYHRAPRNDIFNLLVEHGADINSTGQYFHTDYIKYRKTAPERKLFDFDTSKLNNQSILMYYVVESPKVVENILEAGANPNHQDSIGNTPLTYAIMTKDIDTVKLLLEYGADPNIRNKYYKRPVDYLAFTSDKDYKISDILNSVPEQKIDLMNQSWMLD